MNTLQAQTAYIGSTEIKQVRLGNELVLAPNGDELWYKANELPSLDLRFADNKSLVDATTGQNLVTFTRASSGTYVDSEGVIRTATTNLLLRSEEFDSADWAVKTNLSVIADTVTAPNGTLTADKLVENSANAEHFIPQTVSGLNLANVYTLSVYLKSAERSHARIRLGASGNFVDVVVDLSDGTLGTPGTGGTGSAPIANVTSLGDGWFRVSISGANVGASNTLIPSIAIHNGTTASYQGDGTSGIYIWGAQLEQSTTVGEYIPTTSTINSAPRFDHNPTTGESLGLLVEEQRTNLLLRSEEFGTTWITAGSPTITADTWTAPNGTLTGDSVTVGTDSVAIGQDVTVLSSTVYALSFYINTALTTCAFIRIRFAKDAGASGNAWFQPSTLAFSNLQAGVSSPSAVLVAPNVYKISVLMTFGATDAGSRRISIGATTASGSATSDTGTVIAVWGAQLEAGSFPTSYIPTTTAAATRSADVASIGGSNFSSWYRQDEGTLFAESTNNAANTVRYIYAIQQSGSTSNRIDLNINTSNVMNPRTVVSGSAVTSLSGGTYTSGVAARLAFAFKVTDYGSSLNGATPITAVTASALPASLARMYIGSLVGSGVLNGTIKRLTYFPARLANETLQRITQ